MSEPLSVSRVKTDHAELNNVQQLAGARTLSLLLGRLDDVRKLRESEDDSMRY